MALSSYLLLAFVPLMLINLAASSGDSACSNHGTVTCECLEGYTGPHCSKPINYCNAKIVGNLTFDNICSRHGNCETEPCSGAKCICNYGYEGPLCESPNPSVIRFSDRCYLFDPAARVWNHTIRVGCPAGQRCLTDDLNCPFDHPRCANPIGWCTLESTASQFVKTRDAAIKNFHSQAAEVIPPNSKANAGPNKHIIIHLEKNKFVDISTSVCNDHGTGSCTCNFGWTGPDCSIPIDFCKTAEAGKELGQVVGVLGGVCGPHGTCVNHDGLGLTCTCAKGWNGTLCDNPIPSVVTESNRCYLFTPTKITARPDVRVGCSAAHRCLCDDLNCPFDNQCTNPIGWCLPEKHVSSLYNVLQQKMPQQKHFM